MTDYNITDYYPELFGHPTAGAPSPLDFPGAKGALVGTGVAPAAWDARNPHPQAVQPYMPMRYNPFGGNNPYERLYSSPYQNWQAAQNAPINSGSASSGMGIGIPFSPSSDSGGSSPWANALKDAAQGSLGFGTMGGSILGGAGLLGLI